MAAAVPAACRVGEGGEEGDEDWDAELEAEQATQGGAGQQPQQPRGVAYAVVKGAGGLTTLMPVPAAGGEDEAEAAEEEEDEEDEEEADWSAESGDEEAEIPRPAGAAEYRVVVGEGGLKTLTPVKPAAAPEEAPAAAEAAAEEEATAAEAAAAAEAKAGAPPGKDQGQDEEPREARNAPPSPALSASSTASSSSSSSSSSSPSHSSPPSPLSSAAASPASPPVQEADDAAGRATPDLSLGALRWSVSSPSRKRQNSEERLDLPDLPDTPSPTAVRAPRDDDGEEDGSGSDSDPDRSSVPLPLPFEVHVERPRHHRGGRPASASPRAGSRRPRAASGSRPGSACSAGGHRGDEEADEYARGSVSFRSGDLSFLGKLQTQLKHLPKVEAGRSSFVAYPQGGDVKEEDEDEEGEAEEKEDADEGAAAPPPPPPVVDEDAARVDRAVRIEDGGRRVTTLAAVAADADIFTEAPFAYARYEDGDSLPEALLEQRDPPLPLEPQQLALLVACLGSPRALERVRALRPRLPDGAVDGARERFGELHRLFAEHGNFVPAGTPPPPPQAFFELAVTVRLYAFDGGLYRAGTVLRHSCEPSAEWVVDEEDGGRARLVALRDLAAGDEVTVSYFQGNGFFGRMPQRRRQMMLNSTGHGFVCACSRCAAGR